MKVRTCIAGLLLAGVTAIPACGNSAVASYCEEMCDCAGCNDDDVDACEATYSGQVDAAGEYDCKTEYNALLQCQADEGRCEKAGDTKRFTVTDDCADEADDYADCVEDASDLDDSSSGTTSGGSTTSSSASGGGTDNVTACNNFVNAVMCGTVDVAMYVNCSQYSTTPCDISGYFDCLSTNTSCANGVLDTSGWAQCAAQAQCT